MPTPTHDEARTRDIVRVFCRIPMPWPQRIVVKALIEADAPVRASALRDRLDVQPTAFPGIMGAFGRRIDGTKTETSHKGQKLLLHRKWLGDENEYSAIPELVAAVALVPQLAADVGQEYEKLRRAPDGVFPLPPGLTWEVGEKTVLPSEPKEPVAAKACGDLHLSRETVGNFILALQTKRFVLLSGISGTGKTQLGLALASAYRRHAAVRRRDSPIEGAYEIMVKPYMSKYRRIGLPVELVTEWRQLDETKGGGQKVPVRFGRQKHECSIYVGDTTTLLLSGGARTWFDQNLAMVGDTFFVNVEKDSAGEPSALRLSLPTATTKTVEVRHSAVVAVRPDWTDNRGLLGYFNPITMQYVSTPFLDLLLRAHADATVAGDESGEYRPDASPYFVILDEMNLARVEHYFSDFLSAMESGEPLALHSNEKVASGESGAPGSPPIPRAVSVPPNLYFVGTVNIDETTYMFSPKVLDRAFTIELNEVDLPGFAGSAGDDTPLDLALWDGTLTPAGTPKPSQADWKAFVQLVGGALADQLIALHKLLAEDNRHFGYRVANEIARFVCLAYTQCADKAAAANLAFDLAVLQKVLVKLHGTQQELEELVDRLTHFAATAATARADVARAWIATEGDLDPAQFKLPRCGKKLIRMRNQLRQRGFTSWIE